ncbi:hypothetical protein HDU67_004195, partial [Dinochytrium kinnereticum]
LRSLQRRRARHSLHLPRQPASKMVSRDPRSRGRGCSVWVWRGLDHRAVHTEGVDWTGLREGGGGGEESWGAACFCCAGGCVLCFDGWERWGVEDAAAW